jgi:hypothetical protein
MVVIVSALPAVARRPAGSPYPQGRRRSAIEAENTRRDESAQLAEQIVRVDVGSDGCVTGGRSADATGSEQPPPTGCRSAKASLSSDSTVASPRSSRGTQVVFASGRPAGSEERKAFPIAAIARDGDVGFELRGPPVRAKQLPRRLSALADHHKSCRRLGRTRNASRCSASGGKASRKPRSKG